MRGGTQWAGGFIGLLLIAPSLDAQPNEEKEIGGKKLKQWIAEIRHQDPGVRENAIRTVMLFGKDARKAGKALILELKDADPSLRSNAAIVIGTVGLEADDVEEGVKGLGRLVQSDNQAVVRVQAALALSTFGHDAKAAIPQLVAAARDTFASWEVRRAAAIALATVALDPKDGPDPRAIVALTGNVRSDPCNKVRLHALSSLIILGKPPPTPAGDPQTSAQREAQAAALRGEKTALEAAIRDPDKLVSLWARVALMRIDKVAEAHLIQIGLALKSTDTALRVNAAQALGMIGSEGKSQVSHLIAALKDKEPVVVASAAAALAFMGEDALAALPTLKELAEDKDELLKNVAKKTIEHLTKADNKLKKPAGK